VSPGTSATESPAPSTVVSPAVSETPSATASPPPSASPVTSVSAASPCPLDPLSEQESSALPPSNAKDTASGANNGETLSNFITFPKYPR
jgi:hypothetical protein